MHYWELEINYVLTHMEQAVQGVISGRLSSRILVPCGVAEVGDVSSVQWPPRLGSCVFALA